MSADGPLERFFLSFQCVFELDYAERCKIFSSTKA